MKFAQKLQQLVVASACLGLLVPTAVFAQQPTTAKNPQPNFVDAKLADDGALYGKVVDAAGVGISDANIILKQNNNTVAQSKSMEGGLFRIAPLNGGIYTAIAGGQPTNLRLWTKNAAPPAVVSEVLLVANNITRAQGCDTGACGPAPAYYDGGACGSCGGGGCDSCGGGGFLGGGGGGILGFLTNPWVIAGGIAAAIAIPLALDDDDDAS